MKLCRFRIQDGEIRVGLISTDGRLHDLTAAGITLLEQVLEAPAPLAELTRLAQSRLPEVELPNVTLCAPVDRQEVWAAGVTYSRSKQARMEESDFSASAYDKVYEAERPELFFKSQPQKVSGPGEPVGIRRDSRWSVPEPELALVLNSRGQLVGYTVGNDVSSRDIEGENLLYLPQAKIYTQSCALGPWIAVGAPEITAREWTIRLRIQRGGSEVFGGETSVNQIKRGFEQLAEFLFRSQAFPQGAILLTGTGIVPPDSFTLEANDIVRIEITGIGVLENTVAKV
jgi:2-dehydro-3-deoxy-D-arabinonate dehydratase